MLSTHFHTYRDLKFGERAKAYVDSVTVRDRYTISRPYAKWVTVLHEDRDFAAIQVKADALLVASIDGVAANEYAAFVNRLEDIPAQTKNEQVEQTYADWIQSDPESALPFLVRGQYYIDRAWEARGTGFSDTVSEEQFELLFNWLGKARVDLERAYKMNPKDPASSTHLIVVAMGSQLGKEIEQRYFSNAIESMAYYVSAYSAMLSCLQPKWGGSRESAKNFVETSLEQFDTNPMIVTIQDSLLYQQRHYEDGSEDILKRLDVAQDMISKYRILRDLYPTHKGINLKCFIWARRVDDYKLQFDAASTIGDTYIYSTSFKSLESYHYGRINAIRNYAKTTEGEERIRLYKELIEMAPKWPTPLSDIGGVFWNDGNKEQAFRYYENAAQLGSNYFWMYRTLAREAMRTRRYEDALKYIERGEPLIKKDIDRQRFSILRSETEKAIERERSRAGLRK
ncbi:MAG: DUF4034 domain-containing protein [Candidatus Hydrogenedentota bacterium]